MTDRTAQGSLVEKTIRKVHQLLDDADFESAEQLLHKVSEQTLAAETNEVQAEFYGLRGACALGEEEIEIALGHYAKALGLLTDTPATEADVWNTLAAQLRNTDALSTELGLALVEDAAEVLLAADRPVLAKSFVTFRIEVGEREEHDPEELGGAYLAFLEACAAAQDSEAGLKFATEARLDSLSEELRPVASMLIGDLALGTGEAADLDRAEREYQSVVKGSDEPEYRAEALAMLVEVYDRMDQRDLVTKTNAQFESELANIDAELAEELKDRVSQFL